jgi:hypothetical protein
VTPRFSISFSVNFFCQGQMLILIIKEENIILNLETNYIQSNVQLSDTILKRNHPSQIWFNLVQRFQKRRFKCDFSLKYAYLHNRYKSTERNISQKQLEHMLNYSYGSFSKLCLTVPLSIHDGGGY